MVEPDRFEFSNEGFLWGQKHLLRSIARKKDRPSTSIFQSSSVAACVEIGNFGVHEDVERHKRDKNVLMQEHLRLSSTAVSTDHQLYTVGQHVQVTEQLQKQIMSFLAKGMQSPAILKSDCTAAE